MMRNALAGLVLLIASSSAEAACACRCVNGMSQAVCDSVQDRVPICGGIACKLAPATIRPTEAPKVPPAGGSRCDQVQVYSNLSGRYEWTQLCTAATPSFAGLLKPRHIAVTPSAAARATGVPCGTDADCPSGFACRRRNMDSPWACQRR
jgi:hypothetical protein